MYHQLNRRLRPALVLTVAALLAGCGGAAQSPMSPTSADSVLPQSNAGSTTVRASSAGARAESPEVTTALASFTVQGQVAALQSGGFQIQTNAGLVSIIPTPTTSRFYNQLYPAVGEYAIVTATGSPAAPVPILIGLFPSPPPTGTTVIGTVMSEQPYGVAIKLDTTGKYIPLAFSTSTALQGFVARGTHITATGAGTVGAMFPTTVTPTSRPLNVNVPNHVMTATVFWGYGGVPTSVPIAAAAPWLTWVQTSPQYAAAIRAAGIKVDSYVNFWRNYSIENPPIGYNDLKPGGMHADAEAKTCGGTAIEDPTYGGGYEADARSADAVPHAQILANYRKQQYGDNMDALFADDTGAMGGISLPCNWSLSSYQAATGNVLASLAMPTFINAIGASADPVGQVGYTSAPNVIGAMCEICYAAYSKAKGSDIPHTDQRWINIENAEIATIQRQKIFWAYPRSVGDASAETALRSYAYASFLLTYDPQYAMFQEIFKTPSGFPIFPEVAMVPMNPLSTATAVSGYQRAGGAYMREYSACYYSGVNKGPCAVVINPSSKVAAPLPTTAYTHSMALSGYGVLDGGTASFDGSVPSTLAPQTGMVLFQ